MSTQNGPSKDGSSKVLRFAHSKDSLRKVVVSDGSGDYEVYRLAPSAADWPAGEIPDEVNPRSHGEECLKTSVAKSIEATLRDHPEDFWLANRGGFVLAEKVRFDPERETVHLYISDPELHGIADGATTNAVINKLQEEFRQTGDPDLGAALESARFNLDVVVALDDRERIATLVEGRNTSRQVKSWSLNDFRGRFDWLADLIDRQDGPFNGRIGWEENSGKSVSVLDLISVLTLFHPVYDDPKDRRRKAPTAGFSSKGTSDKRLTDERMAPGYRQLEPVIEDILRLWEHVHANFEPTYERWNEETHGKGSRLGRRKGVRNVTPNDVKTGKDALPLTGLKTEYFVEKGLLFPLLASFRALLEFDEDGARWTVDPIEFFDKYGADQMDVLIGHYIDAAGKNPATLGKMKIAYLSLHDRVRNLLRERELAAEEA